MAKIALIGVEVANCGISSRGKEENAEKLGEQPRYFDALFSMFFFPIAENKRIFYMFSGDKCSVKACDAV